ncbi:copper-binding protein [Secundilactobacillus oryzae JCM 18671]|uniref:Copper-binding protein n=1 Tax=Secundilactobacillus oryzae JCM 18671 TaxID=1291743 RepID=A0A081BG92_9LACO|nr:cupredoxin domain-containing protein [Secundilactobacillus oryzae]GAK47060.1 copper-binding protein [Secundilactobacillus oryzae JCM 18671]
MTQLITLVLSILIVGFVIWWFFGHREEEAVQANVADGTQQVDIVVDGGYSPSTVVLKQGQPANLIFERKDPSNCLEQVTFADFGINEFLPQKEKHAISIDTSKFGEYDFACGMNMFHGKVVVR